jgi:hypothetical protein
VEDWKMIYQRRCFSGIIDEPECVVLRLGFCFVLQWLGRSDESLT